MLKASILMPFGRDDCAHRARARRWVVSHYLTNHIDWQLEQGYCEDDEWSKGIAVADAFQRADHDVLVIADADSFIAPEVLVDCVAKVTESRGWAVPHSMVYRLNEEQTEKLYNGSPLPRTLKWQQLARPAYRSVSGGGITVVHRSAYLKVGGIDPRFLGWGGEDVCFGWALHALVGLPHAGRGDLIHLWHPHALGDKADTLRGSAESEALVARYRAARRSPEQMREVIGWTRPA